MFIKGQKTNKKNNHKKNKAMTLVKFRNPRYMFFDQLLGNDFLGGKERSQYPQFAHPATNITEDQDGYRIYMAVPGIQKEQIKIDLENNQLTISYDSGEQETKGNYLRREFNNDSFSRTFIISDKTLPEQSKANYNNGILTIFIPKKQASEITNIRNIKIQ